MQVAKWGNSLAVRLPATVVEALSLKEGDEIKIQVAGARAFEVKKRPGARERPGQRQDDVLELIAVHLPHLPVPPGKGGLRDPPFEALRQKDGFYQCRAPCRRRRPNHGHCFTLQRDGAGGF